MHRCRCLRPQQLEIGKIILDFIFARQFGCQFEFLCADFLALHVQVSRSRLTLAKLIVAGWQWHSQLLSLSGVCLCKS